MDIIQILKIVVALMTIATGLLALVRPRSVTGFIGLNPEGVRGLSEIRAVFGGLPIGIGLAPLLLTTTASYEMLGIGYLAIGVTRTFSIFYDKSYAQSNIISVVIEYIFGVLLLLQTSN